LQTSVKSHFRNNYLRTFHSLGSVQGRLIGQIKTMSRTSTCAFWEEQRLSSQDEEPKLRPGEIAEHAAQTRRVVIDLSGVEMIDAAGLGALISVALTAQASQCSVKLAAPGNLILSLAKTLADRRINSLQQYFQSLI